MRVLFSKLKVRVRLFLAINRECSTLHYWRLKTGVFASATGHSPFEMFYGLALINVRLPKRCDLSKLN